MLRFVAIFILFVFVSYTTQNQEKKFFNTQTASIAQKQLDAYNKRNIEEFLAVYSDNCLITDYKSGDTLMFGKSEMRKRYSEMFSTLTKLNCKINQRITVDKYVIDEEIVYGLRDSGLVHAVAIYEIEGDSIVSVMFVR